MKNTFNDIFCTALFVFTILGLFIGLAFIDTSEAQVKAISRAHDRVQLDSFTPNDNYGDDGSGDGSGDYGDGYDNYGDGY